MEEIRTRILLLVKDLNWNLSQFAKELGVAQPVISHISSGRNLPSLDLVMRVLKRFPEINPDWLLFGSGTKERKTAIDSSKELQALEESINSSIKNFNNLKKAIDRK